MADCLQNEGKSGKYGLTSDTVIDACKPRFNTKTISRFCLTNRATNEFCIPLLETGNKYVCHFTKFSSCQQEWSLPVRSSNLWLVNLPQSTSSLTDP